MNGINIKSNCQLMIDLCIPDEAAVVEIKVYTKDGMTDAMYHIENIPVVWDNEVIIQAMEVTRHIKEETRGAV